MLAFRRLLLAAISLTAFAGASATSLAADEQPTKFPPGRELPSQLRISPSDHDCETPTGAPGQTCQLTHKYGAAINSIITAGSWLLAPLPGQ